MTQKEVTRIVTKVERLEAMAETAPPKTKAYLLIKAAEILVEAIVKTR